MRVDEQANTGERTSGARAILSRPAAYELFQRAVGSPNVRRELASVYLRAQPGQRVLDIGCGPGDVLAALPDVDYVGFDPSARYIAAAQRRWAGRGTFLVAGVGDVDPAAIGAFDLVFAKGVLHHLGDDDARALFRLGRAVLSPQGRLVTIDPCFSPVQSPIARMVIARDRGRHVRTLAAYRALAAGVFDTVDAHERHDLLRIPYTHAVVEGR